MSVYKFKTLAEELSALIEKEGWSVLPYQSPTLPFFRSLTDQQQLEVIQNLNDFLIICKLIQKRGESLKDSRALVKEALRYYSFDLTDEVFEMIEKGYVVEFYNLQHTQLFRTFNYFEFTSYTLEDIYCRSWFTLYDDSTNSAEQMMIQGAPIAMGQAKGPLRMNIPPRHITERASLERLEFVQETIWVAALHKKDKLFGYISIINATK